MAAHRLGALEGGVWHGPRYLKGRYPPPLLRGGGVPPTPSNASLPPPPQRRKGWGLELN